MREALGVREEGGVEDGSAARESRRGEAVVHLVRRAEAERAVMVFVVVPVEEARGVARACSMQPKRSGKPGRYLSVLKGDSEKGLSFETCGRECVLVTPRSASSNATDLLVIGAAAVGVERELPGLDALAAARLVDELAGEGRALLVRDHPADDVAAEDVEDDVQVEVGPLLRPEQLGDVPAPQLVRPRGEQLGRGWFAWRSWSRRSRTSSFAARIRYIVRSEQR